MELGAIIVGGTGLVGGAISTMITLKVAVAVEKLRTEIVEARAKDREELKVWINGSFMRAKEVELKFEAFQGQLQSAQQSQHSQHGGHRKAN